MDNEDVVGAAPTGNAPTTSELSTMISPTKVQLILEVWQYIGTTEDISLILAVHQCLTSFHNIRTASSCSNLSCFSCSYRCLCLQAATWGPINDNKWKDAIYIWRAWPQFNIKMSSYRYRKSHCGDKTVVRLFYLHIGISYTGKATCLYWIGALDLFWGIYTK